MNIELAFAEWGDTWTNAFAEEVTVTRFTVGSPLVLFVSEQVFVLAPGDTLTAPALTLTAPALEGTL